jgi:hypothetical protein
VTLPRLSNEIPFWAMDNDFELKLAGLENRSNKSATGRE